MFRGNGAKIGPEVFWLLLLLLFVVLSPCVGIGIWMQAHEDSNTLARDNARTAAYANTGIHYPANTAQMSGKAKVLPQDGSVTFTNGSLTFTDVEVATSGDYYLTTTQTKFDYSDANGPFDADVTVNGSSAGKLRIGSLDTDKCSFNFCPPFSIKIHLNAGRNTIVLSSGTVCPPNSISCSDGEPIKEIVIFSDNGDSLTSPQN